jgi:Putative transposase
MVELAEIFRRSGPAYRAKYKDHMLPGHLAAMAVIAHCRTECLAGMSTSALSGENGSTASIPARIDIVPSAKTSPRPTGWQSNRPCSSLCRICWAPLRCPRNCGQLPVPTRPAYTTSFQTSAAALQALALDPKYLGGHIGLVGGLHPWTRDLAYHPHLHSLVPGGALASDGVQWRSPRSPDWLGPVQALSELCRGKFRAALTTTGLPPSVPPQVWSKGWLTPCQPAGTGTAVLAYFAPYIHRVAITNNRLEPLENGAVPFRAKAHGSKEGTHRTLPTEAFIRHFLQHVLPKGCSKVRYYGSLSPSRRTALTQIRTLLATCPSNTPVPASSQNRERQEMLPAPEEAWHCRHCGGPLVFLVRLSPTTRGPPS